MSKYTTGEIAKLCGVSVRTVQYYDTRGILAPSELTEGGRRLYSEDDLKRLKIICFLRDADISINSIGELLSEEQPGSVISVLLEQQEQLLQEEVRKRQAKLDMLAEIKRELKSVENFSIESIGDIAFVMKNKNKLKKIRWLMVLTGIPITVLQWTSIILWITNGLWWLFLIWVCIAVPWGITVSTNYFKRIAYICPECHEVFRSRFKDVFWAYHTLNMRRLTCPRCGYKGLCVEVYAGKEEKNNV